MIWTSDTAWMVIYTILITLLMLVSLGHRSGVNDVPSWAGHAPATRWAWGLNGRPTLDGAW
jgi:hypothetical protein